MIEFIFRDIFAAVKSSLVEGLSIRDLRREKEWKNRDKKCRKLKTMLN